MNKRGEQMRFDEELLGGGLNPEFATNATSLTGEQALPLPRADMFYNAVGKNDSESLVGEWQGATVSTQIGEAGFLLNDLAAKIAI
jgi:hypothetical protein